MATDKERLDWADQADLDLVTVIDDAKGRRVWTCMTEEESPWFDTIREAIDFTMGKPDVG